MPTYQIQHRADTTSNWESANPILLYGEIGLELTMDQGFLFKFGDGVTPWLELAYTSGAQGEKGDLPTLSNAINSTSETEAASSLAVKLINDKAQTAQTTANNALPKRNGIADGYLGIGKSFEDANAYLTAAITFMPINNYPEDWNLKLRNVYSKEGQHYVQFYTDVGGYTNLFTISPNGISGTHFAEAIPMPRAKKGGGLGEFISIWVDGTNFTLPSGGTWLYDVQNYTVEHGTLSHAHRHTGIKAGGTTIYLQAGFKGLSGWAWRIA